MTKNSSAEASQLESLQRCRAELDRALPRLERLEATLIGASKRVAMVEKAVASYLADTKNPFILLWSRVSRPGAMRRNRKAVENELKSIRKDLQKLQEKPLPAQETPVSNPVTFDSLSNQEARHHIVITGTGRAGTTFLMELLTSLGLPTGFEHYSDLVNKHSHAGLEWDIRSPDTPYIVKNPRLCDDLAEVIGEGTVIVDHAFVPVRDLTAAARSRARITAIAATNEKVHDATRAPGGLWDTSDGSQQEIVLMEKLCNLLVTLARHNVPTTLLFYPQLVEDAAYLFEKLSPILDGISFEVFEPIFQRVSRPDLVTRDL